MHTEIFRDKLHIPVVYFASRKRLMYRWTDRWKMWWNKYNKMLMAEHDEEFKDIPSKILLTFLCVGNFFIRKCWINWIYTYFLHEKYRKTG